MSKLLTITKGVSSAEFDLDLDFPVGPNSASPIDDVSLDMITQLSEEMLPRANADEAYQRERLLSKCLEPFRL